MQLNQFAALFFSFFHGSFSFLHGSYVGGVLLESQVVYCVNIILLHGAKVDTPARCKHLLLLLQKLLLNNSEVLLVELMVVRDQLLQLCQSRRTSALEARSVLLANGLEKRMRADKGLLQIWMLEKFLVH